jgi:hypothetical protein
VEDSFAKGLEAVMHDDNFPKRILADILRRKSKWKFERSEAEQYDVVPENSATVQQRTDSTLQAAADAAAEAALGAGVNPDEKAKKTMQTSETGTSTDSMMEVWTTIGTPPSMKAP